MFKCIICNQNSEPNERATKAVLQSKVVFQNKEGEIKGTEYQDGLYQGMRIVKEGLAHKGCYSTADLIREDRLMAERWGGQS